MFKTPDKRMTRHKGRQSAERKTLSAKRLREVLSYNPVTGIFRWRVDKGHVKAGDVAGCSRRRGPL